MLADTMSEQARIVTLPTTPQGERQDPQPEAKRVERVLAEIREDARARAPRYLDDTVVPEGGE